MLKFWKSMHLSNPHLGISFMVLFWAESDMPDSDERWMKKIFIVTKLGFRSFVLVWNFIVIKHSVGVSTDFPCIAQSSFSIIPPTYSSILWNIFFTHLLYAFFFNISFLCILTNRTRKPTLRSYADLAVSWSSFPCGGSFFFWCF